MTRDREYWRHGSPVRLRCAATSPAWVRAYPGRWVRCAVATRYWHVRVGDRLDTALTLAAARRRAEKMAQAALVGAINCAGRVDKRD